MTRLNKSLGMTKIIRLFEYSTLTTIIFVGGFSRDLYLFWSDLSSDFSITQLTYITVFNTSRSC